MIRRFDTARALVVAFSIVCSIACSKSGGAATPSGTAPIATASAATRPQVCTGEEHTCVLAPSGKVRCSGRNLDGELGDGTGQSRWTWVDVVDLNDATSLACGRAHTCAIRRGGSVVCWGQNAHGELGAGNTDVTHRPIAVSGIANATELGLGRGFSCARRADATVSCWGDGDFGRLGNGSMNSSPAPVGVSGISSAAQLEVGAAHACVRKTDGTVACWGQNQSHQLGAAAPASSPTPIVVAGVVGALTIAAGGNHSCAATATAVSCWGQNSNGQAGSGPIESNAKVSSATPVPGLGAVRQVALGASRSCVVMADGTVKCWGYNNYTAGLLGTGSRDQNVRAPTAVVGAAGIERMDTFDDHACGITTAGALVCWGTASGGRMGNDSNNSLQAATSLVPSVTAMTGASSTMPTFAAAPGDRTAPPHLAVGRDMVCGVKSDGRVFCFGENSSGRLGTGSTRANPSTGSEHVVGISDAVQVATGIAKTCALRRNGTVACWGELGPKLASSHPIPVDGLTGVSAISVGGSAATLTLCARHDDGTVSCVGSLPRGEFSMTPRKIDGLTDVAEVSVGVDSICARRTAGTVACWGSGSHGQIGNGATTAVTVPTDVTGLADATAIVVGSYDACAIRRNKSVVCWGSNDDGQMGNGQSGRDHDVTAPSAVSGLRNAVAIGNINGAVCVAQTSGDAMCWGANDFGQSGSNDLETDDVTAPVRYLRDTEPGVTALGPIAQIGCSTVFCCAIHGTGGVSCAGSTPIGGSGGLLGITSQRSATPIVAPGVTFAVPAP